jgi:hypothetical protein
MRAHRKDLPLFLRDRSLTGDSSLTTDSIAQPVRRRGWAQRCARDAGRRLHNRFSTAAPQLPVSNAFSAATIV